MKKFSNTAQQRNENFVRIQKIDEFFFDVNKLMKNIKNDDDFEIDLNVSNEFMIEFIVVLMILTQIKILKLKKTINRIEK